MRTLTLLLSTLLFAAAGCATEEADCSETAPTWAEVGPIFETHCTHCHNSALSGGDRNGAPAGFNYDTEDGVLAVGSQIMVQLDAGWMPDDDPGAVPEADVELIRSFISCSP